MAKADWNTDDAKCRTCGNEAGPKELWRGQCENCCPDLCERCNDTEATYTPPVSSPAWDIALCDDCKDDHARVLYAGGYTE